MKRIFVFLFLLTAILLPACSVLPASDPLAGTSWQLVALGDQTPLAGAPVTLEFQDGQAGGSAGCNSYGGAYQVNGEKISFSDLVSTLMACTDPGVMEQEAGFLGALNEVERFELSEGQLRLIRAGGQALAFVPSK